jgi:iron complex transport system ATP-binding protein
VSAASGPHLQAIGLGCAIGRREILRDIDLTVARGETVGVVGPNGSGKSTLLRTLAGILPPTTGQLRLLGSPLHGRSARQRAREVAMVGQEDAIADDLLVGELVALGRTPHRAPWSGGGAGERREVARALAAVEMGHAIDRPVQQLSGGERRRALLARGLAQDAPLLILDEPTNHLDVRHQLELLELVRTLRRTVVVAMHDLALAATACDRIVVLHGGTVLSSGPAARALTPEIVSLVFGVRATPVRHPRSGVVHLLFDAMPNPTAEVSCTD